MVGEPAPVIEARELVKEYNTGGTRQRALVGVSLPVPQGCFLSIMGPSGSGKSTLLHLLGGLDEPTSGEVIFEGTPISKLSEKERTLLRRRRIGLVFQAFNLVPVLSAQDNVALPAVIAGEKPPAYADRLARSLELVGLTEHAGQLPSQLSGGQQQRVALARALFMEPAVLLADEPTGNLDTRTGAEVLALFRRVRAEQGTSIVMVTHDPRAAAAGEEVVMLRDGALAGRLALGPIRDSNDSLINGASEKRTQSVLRWLQDLDRPEGLPAPKAPAASSASPTSPAAPVSPTSANRRSRPLRAARPA
jgi:putative ABC transport system ATP-binding protein